jgi:tRNA-Thr(GGU) m(6)t(6)A37 methyltransferase TsaA
VPIGIIHSPCGTAAGTPVQPCFASGIEARVEVFPEYAEGLRDLEGFERIWLLFWCHQARAAQLSVVPYRDCHSHGVFATRAPSRPNPVGMSAVMLLGIRDTVLHVAGVDILNGTPLLDIKPYVSEYDSYAAQRNGWLDNSDARRNIHIADERFFDPAKREP